jgi:Big-like domain-containing protein
MRKLLVAIAVLFAPAACGDNNHVAPPAGPDAAPSPDAAPDAPAVVADGIAAARAAADGTGLSLAIHGVTITYLKPQIAGASTTNDPAGFTIQAQKMGPALFVSVDPATLTPPAAVGDVVDFTITTKGTVAAQPRAQAISSYTRTSTGANVAALIQNITAASDIVAAVDSYDSELITVSGTLSQTFAASGAGFQRSAITTTGLTDPNYQIRAPQALVDAIDMVQNCQITATKVPVGRFNAAVEIGVFTAADFTLTGCPAPVVVSAAALSPTSIKITFSRNIDPYYLLPDGSQFTFDNGLTASAAVVAGRSVTLVTSVQAIGTTYQVTVANSVLDLQGSPVAAPATASFGGFVTPAVVRINEVNANIANSCDLIELRVIADGSMTGFTVKERNGIVAGNGELNFVFPTFIVHKNDIIVVHMNSTNTANCNPNLATQELLTVTDQPAAQFAGNFDTAFDFWSIDNGLTATSNVFTISDAAGSIIDAVFAIDNTTANAAAATLSAAGVVGTANQWSPAQTTYDAATFRSVAVPGLNATGTAATGASIQRINDADTNGAADWTGAAGAASSWGVINAGQNPL